jgi:hypothetical protein
VDHRRPDEADAERLSDSAAKRLLTRASELDATGAAVTDLRAAAAEAGISAHAFDAALAEMRGAEQAGSLDVARPPARRRRRGRLFAVVLGLVFWLILRSRGPSDPEVVAPPSGAMVEESVPLSCLSPQQAAELIRPHLALPTNTIEISAAPGSRTLNVFATPEQLQKVRSVLDKQDVAGSAACAVAPLRAPPR